MLAWEIRIQQLFSAFTPEQITRRDSYWREDDAGIHNVDQNMVLRMRSYESDGHPSRQETVYAAGQNAGTFMSGNDKSGGKSGHLIYADVGSVVAETYNFKVPPGSLLWNSVPFNPTLNPTNTLPPGVASVEDAFQLAKAQMPGANSIDDVSSSLDGIQQQTGNFAIDGDIDLTSPFATYCSLTPQKMMLMNFGAIMFIQMLLTGIPLMMAGPVPVTLNPVGVAVSKLAKIRTATAYTASVSGTIIGSELKSLLLSSVPGIGGAFA